MSDSALFTIFMTLGLCMLFADCQQSKWRHFHIYKECIARGVEPDSCAESSKKVE